MASKKPDFIERGLKDPSPFSRAVFVGLRAVAPALQYLLLATPLIPNFLRSVGLRSIEVATPLLSVDQAVSNLSSPLSLFGLASSSSGSGFGSGLATLGLSLPRALLLGGSVLTTVKQIYWIIYVQQETFTLSNAVIVGFTNALTEVLAAALYFWRGASAASSAGELLTPPIAFGAALVLLGVGAEWTAEYQRKVFKADPHNRGKVFRGGLFGLARHVNFAGFAAWKAGQVYMAAGWVAGSAMAATFLAFFDGKAIPPLDEYCQGRYKEQWTRYKKEVPSKLIPGVW